MNPWIVTRFLALLLVLGPVDAVPPWAPPSELPAQTDLPDPLRKLDGRQVITREDWSEERRPELKAMFQHYMYGHFPPSPKRLRAEVVPVDPVALGGKATLKEIRLRFAGDEAPRINLLLLVPNQRRGPVPVILGLNFCGNHAMLDHPGIALPAGWMPKFCPDCPDNVATDAGRGKDGPSWDVVQVIDRGYALAAFYHGDVEPDQPGAPTGIRAYAARGGMDGALRGAPAASGYDWSTLTAWAWGLHRAVDYLVTEKAIDEKRIAIFGHSRNGKTALLAGAFDERIGLVLCHQAGCGGSAPSRGKVGESVKQINDRFPHWFNTAFKAFNEEPERLPFDQHELIALCAPRPVLLSNATDDAWANPAGQFEMLRAANPVYRLLGVPGIDATVMPEPGTLISSRLGYFLRPGKHSTTSEDWKAFLDFADAQWGPVSR